MKPNYITRAINKLNPRKSIPEKLSKIIVLEKKVSSLNKSHSPIYDKSVPQTAVDKCFENLENGTYEKFFEERAKNENRKNRGIGWINRGKIISRNERIVFPVTKSVLGTARIFNKNNLNIYLKLATRVYKIVKMHKNKFKHFEIQPINILGIKELKTGEYAVLEKVHPSMSLSDLSMWGQTSGKNRFSKATYRMLKKKYPEFDEFRFQIELSNAYTEYELTFKHTGIDFASSNVLVLDYNPKTKKFLFGPIDYKINVPKL